MSNITAEVPAGLLRIEIEPDRERVIVRPVGEIDISTVHQLEHAVNDLLERGFDALVLDLGALAFIDGRGLRCIHDVAMTLRERLTVLPGPAAVERAFDISGYHELIPFERPRRRFARQVRN